MIEEVKDHVIYQQGEPSVESKFIPPTLVLNPPGECKLLNNEIFGPILPIVEYDDINPIIDNIKKGKAGLTLYYFGDNETFTYKRLLNETSSGSIVTNEQGLCFVSMTTGFGGVGNSGQGKLVGFDGFKQCSHDKVVIECPRKKLFDVEDRYQEINSSSRKTFYKVSTIIGHRTIQELMGYGKCVLVLLVLAIIVMLFWKRILVFNI